MRPLDWAVLIGTLTSIIGYGLWRARDTSSVAKYLLGGRTMPWYAMALSIMATQASAITFISTTGQAYVDGMRFIQFYFGLPLAMVLISIFAVSRFSHANVYTAYEYLERRFDSKTRILVSTVFLIQRGLAVGVSLYAPAVVLTVIFGWPDKYTSLIMGIVVVTFTVVGGVKAITWTDFQQMIIMTIGLCSALLSAILLLPAHVSFLDALHVAGAAGRLNPVVLKFSPHDSYNLWSGLFGGMFLMLAYFGTDQSQVQRYLTGRNIAQSRLSLLFNAIAKIPMQFVILFTGAMVFVFYTFNQPPLLFNHQQLEKIQSNPAYGAIARKYDENFTARKQAAERLIAGQGSVAEFKQAQQSMDATRKSAASLTGIRGFNDANFIFLTFVTKYLPAGLVGLVMAVILAAAMSTISAEINSLATVSTIDIYSRYLKRDATDRHYLIASRLATCFWGIYAVTTAQFGSNLGSLIEAVNRLGSLFYGGMLGVFVLAFFFKRVDGTAAFIAVILGEAAIFAAYQFTTIFFLWYNVIGCIVVVLTGWLISFVTGKTAANA